MDLLARVLLPIPGAQLVGGKMITYSSEGPSRKQGPESDWIRKPLPTGLGAAWEDVNSDPP